MNNVSCRRDMTEILLKSTYSTIQSSKPVTSTNVLHSFISGVAVVFCYINNVTLFCACMTIHERRVEQNRHYLTCHKIKTKEELRQEGKSNSYVICCGGKPPTSREESESLLDKFPRWIVPKIVLKLPCKIIILFLFAGYLAAAINGCINLRQGLKFTELVSENSYFYSYSSYQEEYFTRQIPVMFVIDGTYTYSSATTQANIEDFVSYAQADAYFNDHFEVNWLKIYKSSSFYNASSEAKFIAGLQKFLNRTEYSMFQNDVKIDLANNAITASRFYLLSVNLEDSQEEGKLMLESRDLADDAPFNCFAYHFAYIAYEQYVAILGQTLQSVGIALAAVFVVTCIFMPHPLLVLLCTIAVTMIMVGVFGFLIYIDVALSSITMIHLIMSIGFSVDFTAHVCHGFMISDGKTRDIRVKQAIDKTGAPIFQGAVSSILGVVILFGAKSYIFRTFAAVMCFVLLFGIAHALLLLPVILSWIGPGRLSSAFDEERNAQANNSLPLETRDENGVRNGDFPPVTEETRLTNDRINGGPEITPYGDFES